MLLPRDIRAVKAPPVKIQGIKTKLVAFIAGSLEWEGAGRWIEPFMGSGVVAMNIAPQSAILADSNTHIIALYRAIQSGELSPHRLEAFLKEEGSRLRTRGESHYYEIRSRFNQERSPYDFIFLNRACFNGVMRFNGKGGFNVPFCRKPERFAPALITKICNQVKWAHHVMAGKDWTFIAQDWRQTITMARPNDFIYADPPYFGRHTDYFNRWSATDADELATALKAGSSGFAYSTWKANRYRVNEHLERHFVNLPVVTFEHFYHVGSTENLRNSMEEALVVAPGFLSEAPWTKTSTTPEPQAQLAL